MAGGRNSLDWFDSAIYRSCRAAQPVRPNIQMKMVMVQLVRIRCQHHGKIGAGALGDLVQEGAAILVIAPILGDINVAAIAHHKSGEVERLGEGMLAELVPATLFIAAGIGTEMPDAHDFEAQDALCRGLDNLAVKIQQPIGQRTAHPRRRGELNGEAAGANRLVYDAGAFGRHCDDFENR